MTADDHLLDEAPDRDELPTLIHEAELSTHDLQQLAEAAREFVNEAAGRVAEFERRAAAAEHTIALYQRQERVLARALQDAQRTSDELMETANARAAETVATAQSTAETIIQSARATAQDAQRTSDELMETANARAGETVAGAQSTAETIIQSARATAADTLQRARDAAEEELRAAERTAAEHLARLRDESNRIVEETNRTVREARDTAERYVADITARLDAFVRDREDVSRGLEALARNHAESLQVMTRLRSEVQGQILPTVHRMLRALKGEESSGDDDTATAEPAPPEPETLERATRERATPPEEPTPPVHADEENGSAAGSRHNGQVVVSPIHSFLQATRFMTALSRTSGVASVKLRTYSGAKATIEVITEGRTLAGINFQAIAGFPIEVVESSNVHVVLRIGNPAARSASG